jgi:aminomethyltransferase
MSGYEALRGGSAWVDLSSRGKIRVTGEDRARLLHAMSTNDVKNLAEGAGVYAFFLNEKGRILADAIVYNLGDSLFLDTEAETASSLWGHLDRYIIADDATLEDETATWAAIGLEGPASLETAMGLGLSAPDAPYGVRQWGAGFVAHAGSSSANGLRIFLPVGEKDKFIDRLKAAGVPEASASEARTVRIENGIPRYGEEITDRYLAQETQVAKALHFTKGCYLGQEIVERIRSRGQVHRLLSPIRIHGKIAPQPGTKLVSEAGPVAEISSAVYSPALGEVVGMAYVRGEALQSKPTLTVEGSSPVIGASLA